MMTDAALAEFINTQLLGKPYRIDADGPDEFGCWGLVKYVRGVAFDSDESSIVPPVKVNKLVTFVRDHPERANWREVEKPVHGGVVEMGHGDHSHHVGLWLKFDAGGVLHAHPYGEVGVSFETLNALRAAGWRGFRYHERIA